jgi:hypothetical protein
MIAIVAVEQVYEGVVEKAICLLLSIVLISNIQFFLRSGDDKKVAEKKTAACEAELERR